MSASEGSARKWITRIAILAFITFRLWQLFGPHVTEPGGPVSAAAAEVYTKAQLPPSARNGRIAAYRQCMGYEQYVRFEAPLDACLTYASAILPSEPLHPIDEDQLASDARPRADGFTT